MIKYLMLTQVLMMTDLYSKHCIFYANAVFVHLLKYRINNSNNTIHNHTKKTTDTKHKHERSETEKRKQCNSNPGDKSCF